MEELRKIELPPHIADMREMAEIDRISDKYIQLAQADIDSIEDDIMIESATEKGIARREKILKINPPSDMSLDDRRFIVMMHWFDMYPYTMWSLDTKLYYLVGADWSNISIRVNYEQMKLTIRLALARKWQYAAVVQLLEDIVPLNIVIDIDLMYTTWGEVKQMTWGQVKQKTWKGLKERD